MSHPNRLLAASLIDWTGTGLFLAISAIFLTRSAGLSPGGVGLALSAAGLVALAGGVPIGRLADRWGPREVLLGLHVVRAAGFCGLFAVGGLAPVVALLGVIALADHAAGNVTQALAGQLVPADARVAYMARLRTVVNVGITLGTVPAGLVLASGGGFGLLLAANAASYVTAAGLVATLPRTRLAAPPVRPRLLVPSAAVTALITIDGVMSLWLVLLNVGLPLWIVRSTAAPAALIAVLYGTNTVLAVLLQARLSRRSGTVAGAARAQRAAGLLLAASCGALAVSSVQATGLAVAALVVAVVCLSLGELLVVSAAWQLSFALAPVRREAEFISTFSLGKALRHVVGPAFVTGVVLALGIAGWLGLALLFVLVALATPPLCRRAQARPLGGPPRAPAASHDIARLPLLAPAR